MNTNRLISGIFNEFLKELRNNEDLRNRIVEVIERTSTPPEKPRARSHRRKPGPFDPMLVLRENPEALKTHLEALNVEQLKDIIAEHGMDRDRLAMKWKDKSRLVDRIITTVNSRAKKGDAFRASRSTQETDAELFKIKEHEDDDLSK